MRIWNWIIGLSLGLGFLSLGWAEEVKKPIPPSQSGKKNAPKTPKADANKATPKRLTPPKKRAPQSIPPSQWPALLTAVDKRESLESDLKARMEIILINKAGQKRKRSAVLFQKGNDRRMLQFKQPASEAGISVLIRGTNIHLYLPRFAKIRRIAAHVRNQPFMGSDLTFDDMGSLQYSQRYKVTAVQSQTKHLLLTLKPKQTSSYSKLLLKLRAKDRVLIQIDYFDAQGRAVKRMERKSFQKNKQNFIPQETVVTDLKSKHRSIVRLSNIQIGTGISNRFFSTRYLKRELDL